MSLRSRLLVSLRNGWRQADLDREMDDEMRLHIEMSERDLLRKGVPADEARRQARAAFGSIDAAKDAGRDALGLRLLTELQGDLRYAARLLRRSPAFTAVAVLSLGLGIGANTAIFALVDTVLLKTMPVKEPSRLYFVDNSGGKSDGSNGPPYPCFEILRDHNRFFSGLAAFDGGGPMNVTIDGTPERVRGQFASAAYFDVLGVRPVLGRTFMPADDQPAAGGGTDTPPAVISEVFWERRFARSPEVLGKPILLGRTWVTIVGVTPRAFRGLRPGSPVDLTLPMHVSDNRLTSKEHWWFSVVGRLKDGASVEEAQADLDGMFQAYMTDLGLKGNSRIYFNQIALIPAARGLNDLRHDFATPLWIVMTIVGLVLLIGCANVANLLVARASARQSEIAVRLAIGASRGRLVRQLLTEGALLVALGAAVGLVFARWGVSTLVRFLAGGQGSIQLEPHFDGRVLTFVAIVAALTGLLFSIVPALHATRVDAAKPDNVRTSTPGRRARIGQALVVLQVTLSLVLLSGAALFIRTLQNLNSVDAGFARHGIATMRVEAMLPPFDSKRDAHQEHAQLAQMWEGLLERLHSQPGISSVALSTMSPMARRSRGVLVDVVGAPQRSESDRGISLNHVTADYFDTFGIHLIEGRAFTDRDRATSTRVAILNQSAARLYFGDASPIGRLVKFPGQRIQDPFEIVGVAQDTRYGSLRKQPERMAYLPLSQAVDRVSSVIVGIRAAIEPAGVVGGVRDAAAKTVPGSAVTDVITIDQQIDDSMLRERLVALLATVFGALALVLACMGVYGVLSYAVLRRTREIGIRLAIGAKRASVIWLVVRETALLIVIALAIGIPAVLLTARYVQTQLFEVTPADPLAISAAAALLVAVGALAAFLPARRASNVDPMVALRCE
jgi:predicted permease